MFNWLLTITYWDKSLFESQMVERGVHLGDADGGMRVAKGIKAN